MRTPVPTNRRISVSFGYVPGVTCFSIIDPQVNITNQNVLNTIVLCITSSCANIKAFGSVDIRRNSCSLWEVHRENKKIYALEWMRHQCRNAYVVC